MSVSIMLALKYILILAGGVLGVRLVKELIVFVMSILFGSVMAVTIVNKLTFFGVMVHELSHAAFAILTGAKVVGIDLFHLIPKDGALGTATIAFSNNFILESIQRVFVAVAPIFGGILVIYLMNYIPMDKKWVMILVRYLQFSVLMHTSISLTDIKVGIVGIPIVFILLVVIITALIKFGIIKEI